MEDRHPARREREGSTKEQVRLEKGYCRRDSVGSNVNYAHSKGNRAMVSEVATFKDMREKGKKVKGKI